jgi:hypothetical protein
MGRLGDMWPMNIVPKLLRKILLSNPSFWEGVGLHIDPNHYYQPIPPTDELTALLFARRSECVGIDWNADEQEHHLYNVFAGCANELMPDVNLTMISPMDRTIYCAMIRYYKPRKIVEIGGGESTKIAAAECTNPDREVSCELISIEPFPGPELERGLPGVSRLIKKRVQDVSLDEFVDCDLLFVDSSHVVRMGGDVIWIMQEIIPRVKKGCIVHWHDIFLPGEYLEVWARQRVFWSEQYLVGAFLTFNKSFKILWASHFMHQRNELEIRRVFGKHMVTDNPFSSLWVRRVE